MRPVWNIVHYLRSKVIWDDELKDSPPAIIQAKALQHVLAELPICVNPGETLVGDFGWKCLDTKQRQKLQTEIDNCNIPSTQAENRDKSHNSLMHERFNCYGDYSLGHTCVNYEKIVNSGISGLLDEIEKSRQCASEQKLIYLDAMEITLNAVVAWADRFASLAAQEAENVKSETERTNLLKIAENCKQVPFNPAGDFQQALQSIWLVHCVIGLSELSDASISLGRMDQYLYPIYCQSLDRGEDQSIIRRCIEDLFRKLNRYGDSACGVNLGGIDIEQKDQINQLSWLILNTARKLRMPSPLLAGRIHSDFPPEFFDAMLDAKLVRAGQPNFFGEIPCRKALLERGIDKSVVGDWSTNSSMGLTMQGQEITNMAGGVINLLLPLELTLNNGSTWSHDFPLKLKTEKQEKFKTFDEILQKFYSYLDEIISFCIEESRIATRLAAKVGPNPYLSALLDDCIEKGLDRADGGPRYHQAIIEGFGLINASDSLMAIKKLVYENHNFTLKRLVNAAIDNFANTPSIQNRLMSAPKYGNSDQAADSLAREISDKFAELICKHSDEKICYAPSLQTLNANVTTGELMGASLDGRDAFSPLAKNIATVPDRCTKGHSALLLSATYIDQKKFFGGQALDLYLDTEMLSSLEFKTKFQALLQTYFKMGGLQIQVNSTESNPLEKAPKKTILYEDQIETIAGYSAQFIHFDNQVKKEFTE